MARVRMIWADLRASFWFVPSAILAINVALAVLLIEADSQGVGHALSQWPRLFGAGPAGARGMLSTIAGSMMTVVGITFSMTLVALALASSQYTSRVLRNFMGDRVTQVVLGVFAGIFVYCLIVLRTIRGGDDGAFVPSLSVSFAVVLAIVGVSVLIFFIHHIASSIQASNVVASVAAETLRAVDRLFPQTLGHGPGDSEDPAPPSSETWQAIPASSSGYIQSVDDGALLRLARRYRTVVRMEHGLGDFVVDQTPLASVALAQRPEQGMVDALRSAYVIGRHRTIGQDASFGIRQITDIALRALSPGINDPTTAVMCIDHLTAILARVSARCIPASRRHEQGALRVIAVGSTFASLTADSFDDIRSSAGGNGAILLKMVGALRTLAGVTEDEGRRIVLQAQAERIGELGGRTLDAPHDRERLHLSLSRLRACLEQPWRDPFAMSRHSDA